ncbi:MAG TPA: SDR family oxidoreductase [Amaricoccus sp.]|nr:SDR family oxidoreductase [Amaricoccus sp.]
MSPPAFLMLGHGYSAAALAARLPGWRVQGTTRTPGATLGEGVAPLVWSDAAAVEAAIAAAEAILVSIPPADGGDPALRRYGAALARSPARWVGYLSTTAVYGDRQGGWVDEQSVLAPVSERGRWRVAAEEAWLASGLPVHLFRLAGIYGPGRSAFDKLREGRAHRVVKPGQIFSRIHVADLAATLLASLERPDPGRAYNVADDEPAPPQDVIAHAAGLLGVPLPPEVPFAEAELSPMARSFYGESKRVANRRIKQDLGVRLAFPDYRAGLAAILAAGF